MTKKLILCSIFVIGLLVGIAAQTRVSAQDEPMVGNYREISVKSKEAKNTAAFAVKTRSAKTGKYITLVKITKAEQQVVAGMNYRVCMLVREGRRKAYAVTAVVYLNIKNKRTLSKWKNGGCTDL